MNILKNIQRAGVISVLVLVSSVAIAHTGLRTSNPADGAIVAHAPEQLHLVFTADVALIRLTIADVAGKQVELDFKPSTEAQAEYMVPLPTMQVGNYKAEWAAIGADGHTVTDTFSFEIDPNAQASAGATNTGH